MRIRQKLITGFSIVTLLVFAIGIFGLIASKQITKAFEGGESQFRSIVSLATEISSYAKRAESNLMLYLVLHKNVDKGKFYNRYSSLRTHMDELDSLMHEREARTIFESIKFDVDEFLPLGKKLIKEHDREITRNGYFSIENFRDLVKSFNEIVSSIRRKAIELANFETAFLNRQEAIKAATEISSYIKRAESHLMLYLSIHETDDRDLFFRRLESLIKQIAVLEKRVKDYDARISLERIKVNTTRFTPLARQLIRLHDSDIKKGDWFLFEKYEDQLRRLHTLADEIREDGFNLTKINIKLESQKKEKAIQQTTYIQRMIIAFIFASVLISLLLGYLLSRSISDPIMKLREVASKIGSGELDAPIDIKSRDEIGSLAKTFKQMAENLQKTMVSKSFVDNIITSMMDSLVVVDPSGKIRSVNRALCSMLGYREDDLIGEHVQKIFADSYDFDADLDILKTNGFLSNREETYITKDGKKIPVLFSGSIMNNVERGNQGIVFVALDITNRKVVEEELKRSREQLRNLSAYLQSVREHERTEFAREIHDELGQSLTALKMDLHWLGKKCDNNSPIIAKTQSMLKVIDRTISTVKKICTELRPGVLDDLGLTAAIEWQVGEFEKRSGITCNLFIEPEDIFLDKDRSTAIFRIFQETLTNVARHANASVVNVSLIQKDDRLELEVWDDGRGIRDDEITDAKSFGLIGMKERALFLGGEFRIKGIESKGTTVTVTVPV